MWVFNKAQNRQKRQNHAFKTVIELIPALVIRGEHTNPSLRHRPILEKGITSFSKFSVPTIAFLAF